MNENNSSKIDFNSLSGINNCIESNITSKIDNISFYNISSSTNGGRNIFPESKSKTPKYWFIKDLSPFNFIQISEFFYSNANEGKNSDSIIEQSNKQEDVLMSSKINDDKSCEKLGNSINNSFNASSSNNIEICINNYEEKNHISFLGRKKQHVVDDTTKNQRRKSETVLDPKCKYIGILSSDTKNIDKEELKKNNNLNDENKNKIKNEGINNKEKLRNNFYIFTPSENGNNLRRLIKSNNVIKIRIFSENSNTTSKEKMDN